jgi:hypothetical protein
MGLAGTYSLWDKLLLNIFLESPYSKTPGALEHLVQEPPFCW